MNTKQISVLLSRIALFLIYFWFGVLKVIGLSPASGMVTELFNKTLSHVPIISSISPELFVILFGLFEVLIGLLFIIPGLEKFAVIAFFLHMITTTLPLFFLKDSVWVKILVPTLEGQYVIKNIALIACALNIWSILPKKEAEMV